MDTSFTRNSSKKNQGFTLVELIVVLVILAILAAILVPALTGYIDKAREKTAVSQCRACVVAAQTLASERHGTEEVLTLSEDSEAILSLAEMTGQGEIKILNLTDGDVINKLVWESSSEIIVTYENKTYTIGQTSGLFVSSPTILSNTLASMLTLLSQDSSIKSKNLDSTCTTDGSNLKKLLDADTDNVIADFLKKTNAATWKISDQGNKFSVSDVNITDKSLLDSYVRTIQYNKVSGSYEVGYVKVNRHSNGQYNILDMNKAESTASDLTYAQAMNLYNNMEPTVKTIP
ncbi:MAG: type II secretion system protein [Clostridia bacterium]|nr:type II secretion system protein [Clostridia bacterium]NCC43660.1 type II secretion system protein [Clostridia bacterium]